MSLVAPMINKTYYYITNNTVPYKNMALEEYLMTNVRENECILYLWQNKSTVVIGRNQNAWKECKTSELEDHGGFLARRLSGGGAVFHDLGNLNFTFLVREKDYDVEKQLEVILHAVRKLGINAKKSGRNDIVVDGYKFSGNAFYSSKGHNYHHGTIMFDVNKNDVSKYLNVSKDKLESKGIKSVRSRVANLKDFNPDITLSGLSSALVEAFGEVYETVPQELPNDRIDVSKVKKAAEKFSSWEWKYGSTIKFSYDIYQRFAWGDIELKFAIKDGLIEDLLVYSDALDPHYILELPNTLNRTKFSSLEMAKIIKHMPTSKATRNMSEDIIDLILKQEI